MLNHANNLNHARGFSLVELLLAMLISLIIIGGVMGIYINTRDTQRTADDQLQMVADARFVIQSIGYDLRHAGKWGGTTLDNGILCKAGGDGNCPDADELPDNIAGDCAAEDYMNLSQPIFGFNDSNPYGSTCASNGYAPNTDILQVRYADPTPIDTGSLAAGVIYIRSNAAGGSVFDGGSFPIHWSTVPWRTGDPYDAYTFNYPLRSNTYYVSSYTDTPGDGLPSLRLATLRPGPEVTDEVLLTGVEDFQVQYGIVDDQNTNPEDKDTIVSYISADQVPLNGGWQKVRAVKIWVLMRGEREDREGIGGSQTFTIASQPAQTFNDGYRRFLVSSVVRTRNTNRLGEN